MYFKRKSAKLPHSQTKILLLNTEPPLLITCAQILANALQETTVLPKSFGNKLMKLNSTNGEEPESPPNRH